jgi:flagellar biosynthesis anti-sigma factor FlgM
MAIHGIVPQNVPHQVANEALRNTHPSTSSPSPEGATRAKESDSVYISEQSREFFKVRQLVKQLPEVRTDRVNQLNTRIEKGNYNVPAEKIADETIRKHLVDLHV